MSNTDEKVIEKIQKLFALAESSNEHEAALALERAHDLLKKHNLSMEEVSVPVEDTTVIEEEYESGMRMALWKNPLVGAICRANYCDAYTLLSRKVNAKRTGYQMFKSLRIVGKRHNVAVARVMVDYLFSTIERLAKQVPSKGRESYRKGIAIALIERLEELRRKDLAASNSSTELMVREDTAADDYLRQKGTQKSRQSMNANPDEYLRGVVAGNGISLNQQVGGASKRCVARIGQ